MKKLIDYSLILILTGMFWGCKKDNYPGGTVSPYIALFDIRNMGNKGTEVTLTKENMFGADKIAVVVISDHSANNLPSGYLVVQDRRRLGQLRGITIPVGTAASNYVPGDSLIIKVEGKILKRINNILQLTGVTESDITKVASGVALVPSFKKANEIIANPEIFESTLIAITSAGFDPSVPAGSTYAGDKIINDGFGNVNLHTEANASFANTVIPYLSNFVGIVFPGSDGKPNIWPRTINDITVLSSTAPKIAAFVITGYLTDPTGTDANYEYIQFLATKNIDFSVTNFSIVTNNNAGASVAPPAGWATGSTRTYKFNLTSGTVSAGQYFYVGGNKNIWGTGSTDISSAKWFGKLYSTIDGDDFGTKTTNLLANSGNVAGIAVFDKITVDETTIPVDVIFYGGNGPLYSAGPPEKGYRITNTDYYSEKNPINQVAQPFYTQGSNTGKFGFPTTANFSKLGGKYNKTTGRWTTARLLSNTVLTATSQLSEIEGGTIIEQ